MLWLGVKEKYKGEKQWATRLVAGWYAAHNYVWLQHCIFFSYSSNEKLLEISNFYHLTLRWASTMICLKQNVNTYILRLYIIVNLV